MSETFLRTQTALIVRPSDDIAICGAVASFPAADRSVGVDQVTPLFELAVASIRVLVPSLRTQIAASRVPSAEDTTSGSEASCPAADRNVALVGLVHVEAACEWAREDGQTRGRQHNGRNRRDDSTDSSCLLAAHVMPPLVVEDSSNHIRERDS